MKTRPRLLVVAALGVLAASAHGQQPPKAGGAPQDDKFRFKSGIELINVTAYGVRFDAAASFPGCGRKTFSSTRTISRSR